MNPMTNMKNVLKLSEQELRLGMKTSWHDQYRHSAWVFVGGLPYDLTEGDIICVFSQYGEVVNVNLVRDKGTGKSRGFCFICYEDQRSTNLAVDNFNGIKLLGRTIRVDHCEDYKAPKDDKMDEQSRQLHAEGCAPGSRFGNTPQLPTPSSNSDGGLDKGHLPPMESLLKVKTEKEHAPTRRKHKEKKEKKKKKEKKTKDKIQSIFKKRKEDISNSSNSDSSSDSEDERSKKKKTEKKPKQKKDRAPSSSSSSLSSSEDEKTDTRENRKTGRGLKRYRDSISSDVEDSEKAKLAVKKTSHQNNSYQDSSEGVRKEANKNEHRDRCNKEDSGSYSGNVKYPFEYGRSERPYGSQKDENRNRESSNKVTADKYRGRRDPRDDLKSNRDDRVWSKRSEENYDRKHFSHQKRDESKSNQERNNRDEDPFRGSHRRR